ncbi:sporulation protein YpjB [Peribacillus asahii]|uniref:Sporulation protein YpjB n=1 Tax=Peribacillus asahii TaxID=228899 RepID=A0A398BPD8_9BACI|nr:sporulation protein YpjB [Peribacillus asahii]RID89223.1 sporulation protein YpjB [Peribacillus asahii]
MLKKILLCIIALLIVIQHPAFGQTSSSLEQLDALSDKALEMTKLKRYEDSEAMLTHFSDVFLQLTAEESIFDMDELRIITVAHNEALGAVQDEEITDSEKVNAVTKFRLVIDAVKSTHQPLWTNMESSMMDTFSQTKEAALQQNADKVEEELSTLFAQYDMIYPSLKVDLSSETIEQLDTRIHFLNQTRTDLVTDQQAQRELDALRYDLESIFENMEEDEADPSLWWVIITTGSIIISTLSYVGWKKYAAGKNEIKTRKKQDDEY